MPSIGFNLHVDQNKVEAFGFVALDRLGSIGCERRRETNRFE